MHSGAQQQGSCHRLDRRPHLTQALHAAAHLPQPAADYEGDTPCTYPDGKPLKCTYLPNNNDVYARADALWYHLPGTGAGAVQKHHPEQLAIGMSMEVRAAMPCHAVRACVHAVGSSTLIQAAE